MKDSDKQIQDILEMILSLNESIVEAGGTPLDLKQMKDMTVYQLCCMLGSNNIRFYYVKR